MPRLKDMDIYFTIKKVLSVLQISLKRGGVTEGYLFSLTKYGQEGVEGDSPNS